MEARLNEVPVAQEGENLWSAILDSVDSRSRATITKNLIILGEFDNASI